MEYMSNQTQFNLRMERNRYPVLVSQADLAAEIGWTRQTIIDIELGRVQPTEKHEQELLDAIRRVADAKGTQGA